MILDIVRVGIVGAGQNTRQKHIPNLKAIDRVEVASVCNRSMESAQQAAKEFGISEVYQNWGELVKDQEIDAIVIGTWPYMHCPITIAAINAGKHVLCEARMALNASQAHQMLSASRLKPQVVAQLVPSPFTLRVDKTIKKLIASGYLGDILSIEVRDSSGFIDKDSPMHWRQDFELSGVNIMTLGIWYEAIIRWVGQAKSVYAMAKLFTKMRKTAADQLAAVLIPDHLDVIADMYCGAQLTMKISSVAGLCPGPEAWIFGSEATVKFADNKLFCGKRGDKELKEIHIPPEDEGKWQVEQEFINAIRGKGKVNLTRFEDGVKYMEFTEAVYTSIAKGKTIELPLECA